METSEKSMYEGVDFCGTVKTSHEGFCIATLEKLVKYCLGGSYLVIESNPKFSGDIPIMFIV